MKILQPLLPLVAALVLAGCATAPEALNLPAAPVAFKQSQAALTAPTPAPATWWQSFDDPALAGLIERAERSNPGLQVAAARLAQARALLRQADANRLPQAGASAGAARENTALTGGRPATTLSVGASLSYELDLAGRLSGTARAAALDAQQREALLAHTRLLLQAELVRGWYALRATAAELQLVLGTAAAYQDTLRLTERRFAAGDVTELEVARVRSEMAATESEALALQRQQAQLEHALALLVGEPVSALTFDASASLPSALPQVPAGLPSSVLARRPDVAAARDALLAAQTRVGVAQQAWWPSLTLTASGGQASPELSDLFKASAQTWGLAALLSLPLFDGGRREAGVQQARAEMDVAYAGWRQQMLVALKEVEDELAALRWLGEQAQAQDRAVSAAEQVTRLSGARWRNGLVSQLELLDAQRSELRNRRQALQVRAAQVQATVGLMRALGGGWG
jgi:multidrug efflux system outer membrane protein